MGSAFFGLAVSRIDDETGEEYLDTTSASEYKQLLHQEIFLLSYRGNGGFTWKDIYNDMPSYLRRIYLKLISIEVQREKEEMDNANKGHGSSSQSPSANIPKMNSNLGKTKYTPPKMPKR